MIKFTIALRRRQGMTHDEFVQYHRERHAPLSSSLPEVTRFVRRYVQCHPTAETLPGLSDSKIDGTTELWFDDLAVLVALFTSQGYMEKIRPGELNFLDFNICEFLIGTENPVIA